MDYIYIYISVYVCVDSIFDLFFSHLRFRIIATRDCYPLLVANFRNEFLSFPRNLGCLDTKGKKRGGKIRRYPDPISRSAELELAASSSGRIIRNATRVHIDVEGGKRAQTES